MTTGGLIGAIVFVVVVAATSRLWARYIERWARRRREAGSTSVWLKPAPGFTDTPHRRAIRYSLIAAGLVLIVFSRATHGVASVMCLIACFVVLAVVISARWFWAKRPMSR